MAKSSGGSLSHAHPRQQPVRPLALRQRRLLLLLGGLFVAIASLAASRAIPVWREAALRRAPVAELQRRAAEAPNDPQVIWHLARRLREAGQAQQALDALLPALPRAPRDQRLWLLAAETAEAAKRRDMAFNLIGTFVRNNPDNADARLAFARLYLAARAYPRAHAEAAKAAQLARGRADAWRLAGQAALLAGHPADADAALRKAVALDPKDWQNPMAWSEALMRWSRYREAVAPAEQAVQLAPAQQWEPRVVLARSLLLARRGPDDLQRARQLLARLREEQPDNAEAHALWGICLARLGKWNEARAALEEAIRRHPGDPAAFHELARVYRHLGDRNAARRALEQHRRIKLFGERRLALQEMIQETAQKDPQRANDLRLELARGLAANGLRDEALAQYDRILALEPARADVRAERSALLEQARL